MPTALLAGAFGQHNLGDDALLQAFTAELPDWGIVATTGDRLIAEALGCDTVSARRPGAVARQAFGCDAVVVAGGTIFKSLHPSTGRRPLALLANLSALVAGASALRRPVAMVGVGAADLVGRPARALSGVVVRHADLLVLRDEESASELVRAGVTGPFRVGADPAWVLLEPPEQCVSAGSTVLVVPCALATGRDGWEGMVGRLGAAIERMVVAGLEVRLQSWQTSPTKAHQDDSAIIAALTRRLGSKVEVLATPRSLREAADSMGGFSAVLSFRFHGLVAASAAGIPTVAVAHEPKLAGLARRLGQRSVSAEFDPLALAGEIAAASTSGGPSVAAIKAEIAKAEEGFRLLRILLARGASVEADTLGALPLSPWPR
ncbi:MAG: Polysaccharide pyruvyl transferase [Acidimicrobiaceae bacterium]|nr:Polysaccharide pyruvyl transferase [Acidimicrobiaceae bacterium]